MLLLLWAELDAHMYIQPFSDERPIQLRQAAGLPRVAGAAPTGGPEYSQGRAALLPRAAGAATTGGHGCSQGRAALLP